MLNFEKVMYRFLQNAIIDTKEYGPIRFRPMGTQKVLFRQIAVGLEEGIRHFTVLKGRQLGVSTGCIGIDICWPWLYPSTQGAVVVDKDFNIGYFRSIMHSMINSMPRAIRVKEVIDNKDIIQWTNNSMLNWMVAGSKKSGTLGKGKALNYLHGTECGSWVDQAGLQSLMNTLAEFNPNRFYIFESTASGFNMFYDMWRTAQKAVTQKAIFIGWWMKEDYAIPKDDRRFHVYGQKDISDQALPTDEREWKNEIKRLYDFDIRPEQIAWWRWKKEEEELGDVNMMEQEFPPTEDYAFKMTGGKFFKVGNLSTAFRDADVIPWRGLKYTYGDYFYDTRVYQATERQSELKIFKEPSPNGVYILGADPAEGATTGTNPDRFCIQISRVFADRLEQVAVYNTVNTDTARFAWVIAHLAGCYRGRDRLCFVNIEMNGPGQAVLVELNNLITNRSIISHDYLLNRKVDFSEVIPNIAYYVCMQPNKINKTYNLMTRMLGPLKAATMNFYKSEFETGKVIINDKETLREMRFIVVLKTNTNYPKIQADGVEKDDRVMGMALCVEPWVKYLRAHMIGRRLTYQAAMEEESKMIIDPEKGENQVQQIVNKYLTQHKITRHG